MKQVIRTKKTQRPKRRRKDVHVQEIPKSLFPRGTNAKEYRDELVRMMSNLRFTNERVQYSAQISAFNIRSITHKNGFNPSRPEVFRQVAGFVYHYENFCFRGYAFREKLLQFINAMLSLNFDEHDVKLRFIKINPSVIQARLVPLLDRFDKKKTLGRIIKDRNSLTHKLYYGKSFDHFLRPMSLPVPNNDGSFKKWSADWKREITSRSRLTEEFTQIVFDMNHELARKVIAFKKGRR